MEWRPLCSHQALTEGHLGDPSMTAEELELVAAMRRDHSLRSKKAYRDAARAIKPCCHCPQGAPRSREGDS